ncbi:MAG: cold shock CspA family protein [Nitriliruptoraceae bacterium]|jgi:cold shock CspA family protein
MPTGHVKVVHSDRNFGRITGEDGAEVLFSTELVDGVAGSGDEVEYEVSDGETPRDRRATLVTITKKAPASNPVGRTMTQPPSWDALEDLDRARRAARRRRR